MAHEALTSDPPLERASDRSFGLVIAAAFTILALPPLSRGEAPRLWALVAAVVFAAIAIVAPSRLSRLNALWFAFGQTLHKIVNPIVMGVLFFGLLTPIAIVFRLLARDMLALRFDETAESYWMRRDASPSDMRKQF
ncbi:SxtJ family membrane protein [Methylosinus sp. Ce-a6]|uniref:SxtJ family membrane protein n=1 Tax=Methylosinus sp. Ce-a6 TaxID=2172005 RepID=UPI00135B357F|nr:SxtJ family membrane protein [Methylosinus sp. Ce-a6]